MAQFNIQDCVTDDIPGCALTNTALVRQAVEFSLEGHGTIQDIYLVGLLFNKEILLEWHARVEIEKSFMIVRLPVYLPPIEELAIAQVEKHNKAGTMKNLKRYPYPPNSYLLMGGIHPCLFVEENGEFYIKKITMWGSQKLIQDFLSAVTGDLVTATLTTIDFYTPSTEPKPQRPQDVVWLTNFGGSIGILPILQKDAGNTFIYMHNPEEISEGAEFTINHHKYLVGCDDDNGIFIAKISQKKCG